MPIRQMTDKEKEELFGGGIVFLGQKQPSKQVDCPTSACVRQIGVLD